MREFARMGTDLQRLLWLDGGRKLVAVTRLHSFVTFDVSSGAVLHVTHASGDNGAGPWLLTPLLTVHPNGREFATADYYDPRCRTPTPAHIWTLTDTGLISTALPLSANLHGGLAFAPDGSALVGGAPCRTVGPKEFVGEIVWWDLARGEVGSGFAGHAGLAASLAFTADGAHLVSSGGDERIRVWDVATRREVGSRSVRRCHGEPALAPDGRGLAFVHNYGGGFTLLDPLANKKLGKRREVLAHTEVVAQVAYSPTNDRIASVGDRRLRLWTRDGTATGEYVLGTSGLRCVCFAPDGQTVAAADWHGRIFLCDVY